MRKKKSGLQIHEHERWWWLKPIWSTLNQVIAMENVLNVWCSRKCVSESIQIHLQFWLRNQVTLVAKRRVSECLIGLTQSGRWQSGLIVIPYHWRAGEWSCIHATIERLRFSLQCPWIECEECANGAAEPIQFFQTENLKTWLFSTEFNVWLCQKWIWAHN